VDSIVGLFIFLGIAVWQDYHIQKISNVLILFAAFHAVLFQFIQNGIHGLYEAFFHAGCMILILFPLFLFHMLGAGDIKLLGVVAVHLSWQKTVYAFLIGLYLSLFSILFFYFHKKKESVKKIPMAGPLVAGILIVICKEGIF